MPDAPRAPSAFEALRRLRDGNARFVANRLAEQPLTSLGLRELPVAPIPFAIILGCSDARVPAEIVFDQGLGDLFVIRVAGNIVAPSQVGSVEFAAARFGTRLVVVLGHTHCGAIQATLEELRRPLESRSDNLRAIVDRVRPAFSGIIDAKPTLEDATLLRLAGRANIHASADHLRHGSAILQELQRGGLRVIGAEYSVETGVVEFLDTVE